MTSDVSPGLSSSDLRDCGRTDSVKDSQAGMRRTAGPDLQDGVLGELGGSLALSSCSSASLLLLGHVLDMVTEREMGGLNTYRPVTRVQDVKSAGRAVEDSVRRDMRADRDRLPAHLHGELSVSASTLKDSGRPVPTPLGGGIAGHEPPKGLCLGESTRPTRATTAERVAMPFEPVSVGSAVPQGMNWGQAGFDCARLVHKRTIAGVCCAD